MSFNSEDLYKPGDNKYNETPIGGVENYNSRKDDYNKNNHNNYNNYKKDQNKDEKVTSTRGILFKKATRGKATKKTPRNIDDKQNLHLETLLMKCLQFVKIAVTMMKK